MSYDTQTPHIASYVLFKNNEGKVAFLLRSKTGWMDDYYGLPAGKTEENESFEACALREAKEEVGAELSKDDLHFLLAMHRNEKQDSMPFWVDIFFEAKEWNGELKNAETHKHSKLVWLDVDDLPQNVIPNVRAAIKAIKAGQKYCEFGWN